MWTCCALSDAPFISQNRCVIVSGRVPDSDASQLLPIVDRIDKQLNAVRAKYPAYKIAVTGLSVISARNSALMIDKLSDGLTIEIAFVAAFIGLAFWSPVVMLISILPGLFPIVPCRCMLLLTGQGLQFASVIALTVSFGLASARQFTSSTACKSKTSIPIPPWESSARRFWSGRR